MKRYLSMILLCLFLLSVFVFFCFGADIRDALSPKVVCVSLAYGAPEGSDRMYPMVPTSAVLQEEGTAYIYAVEPTDEYPEASYKAVRVEVIVQHCADGVAYVQILRKDYVSSVAVRWDKPLADGIRVCIAQRF